MSYKDKEKNREYNRLWYITNKEKRKAYCEANIEKKKAYAKAYHEAHKDEINARMKAYTKARRQSDPAFRDFTNFRSRLNSLGSKARAKSECPRFEYYFGCTPEKYNQHIESQFSEGMTWDNTQIDHIIPLSLGKGDQEWIMLNHYTNLRPLWPAENMAKGDNLPDFIPEGFPYWQHFLHHFETL